jgi:DNA-nicking Smr family endonuclease
MKKTRHSFTSFKELKHIMKKAQLAPAGEAPPENKTDDEVFMDAMADVREIREFRKIPLSKPPGIAPRVVKPDNTLDILQEIVSGKRKIRLSDTAEYMEWVSPNMRKDIARKLHQGKFSVQDSIDLHGMNLDEAEEAFHAFFMEAFRRRLFCIKVIHGRGLRSPKGPVLKNALKKWLHGGIRKRIIAYSTAQDCDGGLGATYIILMSK